MPEFGYLQDVLALLIAAILVVSIVRSLKISSIVGFLLAGLIIGPCGLGFVSGVEHIKSLGEFGVVFLLFIIGLELPWERLIGLRKYVVKLGLVQVIVTTAIFTVIGCYVFDLKLSISILVGGALSLSSTAIVMQLLIERGDLGTNYGRACFSALLFQDLSVVAFLILLNIMIDNKGMEYSDLIFNLALASLKVVGVLSLIWLAGRLFLRPIYKWVAQARNSELFVALSLLLILTTGYLTYQAGLSMELGAFLAGVLLAETEYKHQVEADIQPFKSLLLGLFFMAVGMDLNINVLLMNPGYIICVVLGLIFLKGIIIAGICRVMSMGWDITIRIVSLLSTGGEFAFVIFLPLLNAGLLSFEVEQTFLIAISLSMIITPLLDFGGKVLSFKFIKSLGKNMIDAKKATEDLQKHVIVVGFGHEGKTVGQLLSKRFIPYVAFDLNLKQVSRGRKKGLPVFFGDARRIEVFKVLGAERASSIVITIDKQSVISRCVMILRREFPEVKVFVRAQNIEQAEKLEKAGAKVIIPEFLEPSFQLVNSVMKSRGISSDEIAATLSKFKEANLDEKEEEKPQIIDVPIQNKI